MNPEKRRLFPSRTTALPGSAIARRRQDVRVRNTVSDGNPKISMKRTISEDCSKDEDNRKKLLCSLARSSNGENRKSLLGLRHIQGEAMRTVPEAKGSSTTTTKSTTGDGVECQAGNGNKAYVCKGCKSRLANGSSIISRIGHGYDEVDELFSRDGVHKSHLPMLFRPNEIVVVFENCQPRAYMLANGPESDQFPLALDCWSWEFDGQFRREQTNVYVNWPSSASEIDISELNTYPLSFDHSGVEALLRKRGETVWKCRRERFVSYDPPNASFQIRTSNPRYMIDMFTYREINDVSESPPQRDDLGQDAMNSDQPPEDPFLLLLPPSILGFGFHDRKWRTLSVDYISDVEWNTKAS
ncbi:hypothetical protein FE257_002422 [Aspergillus nanangensis]|uniref:DUF7025 domain-containing protein n=1 Tax=Aspergillus nanangensis TaxID=2582783 RepID=A0AAD4CCK8_ASPNN|nr:hypothetical protein FE257_002422 [Aspergillus nanangensis]